MSLPPQSQWHLSPPDSTITAVVVVVAAVRVARVVVAAVGVVKPECALFFFFYC